MDSLTFSEILMSVEKEYGADLESVMEHFPLDGDATVGGLVQAIADILTCTPNGRPRACRPSSR
jgi:acyl carrier protein